MTKYIHENFTGIESEELQCRQNLNTIFSILLFEEKISKNTFDEMRTLLDGVGHNLNKVRRDFFDNMHDNFVKKQMTYEIEIDKKNLAVFAFYKKPNERLNKLVDELQKLLQEKC